MKVLHPQNMGYNPLKMKVVGSHGTVDGRNPAITSWWDKFTSLEPFSSTSHHVKSWWVFRDPYNARCHITNWVGFHPLYTLNNQEPFFHCSNGKCSCIVGLLQKRCFSSGKIIFIKVKFMRFDRIRAVWMGRTIYCKRLKVHVFFGRHHGFGDEEPWQGWQNFWEVHFAKLPHPIFIFQGCTVELPRSKCLFVPLWNAFLCIQLVQVTSRQIAIINIIP